MVWWMVPSTHLNSLNFNINDTLHTMVMWWLIVVRQSHIAPYSHKQKKSNPFIFQWIESIKTENGNRNNVRIQYAELARCWCCSRFIVLFSWIYATICEMMCEWYTKQTWQSNAKQYVHLYFQNAMMQKKKLEPKWKKKDGRTEYRISSQTLYRCSATSI